MLNEKLQFKQDGINPKSVSNGLNFSIDEYQDAQKEDLSDCGKYL